MLKPVILRVNSGHVRHSPHDGVICSTMRIVVLLTDKTPVQHNGKTLVCVLDSINQEHWVDEWYIDETVEAEDCVPFPAEKYLSFGYTQDKTPA